MKIYNFEYDGLNLEDFGFVVCEFNFNSSSSVSMGSQIAFNTIPVFNGEKYELVGASYSNCLSTTFQICKKICNGEKDLEIGVQELRRLMAWLNRKEFHKFKLLDIEYMDYYFEGSFNTINKIEIGDKICGLELQFTTNRPFALHEPVKYMFTIAKGGDVKMITDSSDEEGYIYPHTEIELQEGGDLIVTNDLESRRMEVKGCIKGEILTLDFPIISSSIPGHKLQNDFNWIFLRIVNTFKTGRNNFTFSLPCKVTIVYSPIVKVTF